MGRKAKGFRKKLKVRGDRVERTRESLIKYNGELVKEFLESEVYQDIIKPLLDESIASVEGREVNKKWLFGEFNKTVNFSKLQFYCGYSLALKEFNNRIMSFIDAENELKNQKTEEKVAKSQPMVNPFLEDLHDFNKEEEVWET